MVICFVWVSLMSFILMLVVVFIVLVVLLGLNLLMLRFVLFVGISKNLSCGVMFCVFGDCVIYLLDLIDLVEDFGKEILGQVEDQKSVEDCEQGKQY